jgi:hypothetical protein
MDVLPAHPDRRFPQRRWGGTDDNGGYHPQDIRALPATAGTPSPISGVGPAAGVGCLHSTTRQGYPGSLRR